MAQSGPVTLLDSKNLYLEFSGNLLPVTKAGHQLNFKFDVNISLFIYVYFKILFHFFNQIILICFKKAFKDNRCEFSIRMKDPEDHAACRVFFMTEPKVCLLYNSLSINIHFMYSF